MKCPKCLQEIPPGREIGSSCPLCGQVAKTACLDCHFADEHVLVYDIDRGWHK